VFADGDGLRLAPRPFFEPAVQVRRRFGAGLPLGPGQFLQALALLRRQGVETGLGLRALVGLGRVFESHHLRISCE
jgi:hypothetical protein